MLRFFLILFKINNVFLFLILVLVVVCRYVVFWRFGVCLGVRIMEYGNSIVLINVLIIYVNNVNSVIDI